MKPSPNFVITISLLILLAFVVFISSVKADLVLGIGAHNMSDDAFYDRNDNREEKNPVGIIRYEFTITENEVPLEGFCEHVSSIPNGKDKGLNMCGIQVRF